MNTTVEEVVEGIHRIATHVPEADFTFCQYLVVGDDALLFHTGPAQLADLTVKAVGSVIPMDRLRWISWGHVENDESGAAERILAAAPNAQVAVGATGAMLNMFDVAGRPIRPLQDGESIELGGPTLRWLDTPQVPHGWDAGLLYEQRSGTLLCGDLFAVGGALPATTDDDLAGPALAFDAAFPGATALTPGLAPAVRELAHLAPAALAPMHAPAYVGPEAASMLGALADVYAERFDRAVASVG